MLLFSEDNETQLKSIEMLKSLKMPMDDNTCSEVIDKLLQYLQSNNTIFVTIAMQVAMTLSDLDMLDFAQLLPQIIRSVGSSSREIQKMIRSFILSQILESPKFLRQVIANFDDSDWKLRRECVSLIVKVLFKGNNCDTDLNTLVNNLVPLLKDVSYSVVEQAIEALTQIRIIVGTEKLEVMVQPSIRHIFSRHREQICCTSKTNKLISKDLDNADNFPDEVHTQHHNLEVTDDNSFSKFIEPKSIVVFGLIDENDLSLLQDSDWKNRCQAADRIYQLSCNFSKEDIIPYMVDLLQLFSSSFQDENLKIRLTFLKIIEHFIEIVELDALNFIDGFLDLLILTIKDTKEVCRKKGSKLILDLVKLNPKIVFVKLLKFNQTKNGLSDSITSVEYFKIIIMVLLTYPMGIYKTKEIFRSLKLGLSGAKRIKDIVLDALSILDNQIKPRTIIQMFEVHEIELVELIKERFDKFGIPFINKQGDLELSVTKKVCLEMKESQKTLNNDAENIEEDINGIDFAFDTIERIGYEISNSESFEVAIELAPKGNAFVPKLNPQCSIDLKKIGDRENPEIMSPKRKTGLKSKSCNKIAEQPQLPIPEKQKCITQKRLREIVNELQDSDWFIAQKAMVEISDLIPFHIDWICQNITDVVKPIVMQVQNLRSTVSKIAIIACQLLFRSIPRQILEPHLDLLIKCLLRKVGEGNSFICEEIDAALAIMTGNVSIRGILALVSESNAKHPLIRMRVSCLINKILSGLNEIQLEKIMKSHKDIERILPCLVTFFSDGLAETRNASKHSIFLLSKTTEFVS
jgi:hypothetical protein